MGDKKASAQKIINPIRRKTRRRHSTEEKMPSCVEPQRWVDSIERHLM